MHKELFLFARSRFPIQQHSLSHTNLQHNCVYRMTFPTRETRTDFFPSLHAYFSNIFIRKLKLPLFLDIFINEISAVVQKCCDSRRTLKEVEFTHHWTSTTRHSLMRRNHFCHHHRRPQALQECCSSLIQHC